MRLAKANTVLKFPLSKDVELPGICDFFFLNIHPVNFTMKVTGYREATILAQDAV